MILIKQLKINIEKNINTEIYRKSVLLFIKQYFIINKLNYTTTLDEIYTAQNEINTNKINDNRNKCVI